MTSNPIRFATVFVVITALLAGCEQKSSSGSSGGGANPYPLEKVLTAKDGRKLDVVIEGRSESKVFFTSKKDGKRYDYPIEDLGLADKVAIGKLPVKSVPPPADPAVAREAKRTISRVEFRQESIERLKRKLVNLQADKTKAANEGSSARSRAYQREIEKVEKEIGRMEMEIEAENAKR